MGGNRRKQPKEWVVRERGCLAEREGLRNGKEHPGNQNLRCVQKKGTSIKGAQKKKNGQKKKEAA